jgi:acyl-CoA synthetase (AMP-forming)/AMP-acid ligase II
MTQAGGRLHDVDREYFINMLSPFGIEFIVMYGQTEATARITICPPELLKMNISSAGVPIPNGEIQIRESNSEGIGRVVYVGKNVMMGYATSGSDLPRGDDLNGVLETGDLGYILDGALFLTGREKRIVKIFGARVSLDDVDEWLAEFGNGASIQGNDRIEIFFETESIDAHEVKRVISQRLGVHSSGVNVNIIDEIPLLRNQKIDTQALSELIK